MIKEEGSRFKVLLNSIRRLLGSKPPQLPGDPYAERMARFGVVPRVAAAQRLLLNLRRSSIARFRREHARHAIP
jgi:hypothetical protein